jgi:hypothetical protein
VIVLALAIIALGLGGVWLAATKPSAFTNTSVGMLAPLVNTTLKTAGRIIWLLISWASRCSASSISRPVR